MSLEDIPVIRFEEIQGTKEMALDAYEKIRGKKLNRQTIGEIFYTMRLLDRYQISPFPYFACMIQAIPKPEYIRDFQLEAIITDPLPTISIPLISAWRLCLCTRLTKSFPKRTYTKRILRSARS